MRPVLVRSPLALTGSVATGRADMPSFTGQPISPRCTSSESSSALTTRRVYTSRSLAASRDAACASSAALSRARLLCTSENSPEDWLSSKRACALRNARERACLVNHLARFESGSMNAHLRAGAGAGGAAVAAAKRCAEPRRAAGAALGGDARGGGRPGGADAGGGTAVSGILTCICCPGDTPGGTVMAIVAPVGVRMCICCPECTLGGITTAIIWPDAMAV